jgi:hypothetical protein
MSVQWFKIVFVSILVVFLAACQTAGDRTVFKAEKTASYQSLERELNDEVKGLTAEYDATKDTALRDQIRADRTAAARDLDEVRLRANTEKRVYRESERNAARAERNKFNRRQGNQIQVRVDPFGWMEDDEDEKYIDRDGTLGRDDDIRARMAERADRRRQRQG